jgi:F-type H+-transporting ATPase subunit b
MNTIVTILNSLKIDQTFIVQFILFVVFFNIIAPLLFKKLQQVLDLRENKTTKLESHAHHIYKQAEDLAEQYKGSVEKTHQDSQTIASKKKAEILAKEKEVFMSAEEKMNAEYEGKRSALLKELAEKKSAVMAEASVLSNNLVEKLTK